LKEIISYFGDYIEDAEYEQQNQADFIDGVGRFLGRIY